MRTFVLALLGSTLIVTFAVAQAPPPSEPPAGSAPPPAGSAPPPGAPDQQPAPPAAAPAAPAAPPVAAERPPGTPANICAELVAFLTPKPAPSGEANAPPQAPPPQKADQSASSSQQTTGQSGVAVEAPKEGGGTKAPAGGVNSQAPQQSGISAPVPKADANKKPPSITLEQAQAMAQTNDVAACQEAARKERRAGVDMPPALMALAALDLKYHQQAASAAPSGGTTP